MSELDLNEHHQTQIINFLRFARYQRGQRIRAIDVCFDDMKQSRLSMDTTFTKEEIEDILKGLQIIIRGEAETELINAAHTNVLLLRQVIIHKNFHSVKTLN